MPAPREVVGEDVGQTALGREAGGVVGGAEQPDVGHRDRPGVSRATGGRRRRPGCPTPSGDIRAITSSTYCGNRWTASGLDAAGAVPQGVAGDRVGARGPPDAEVDPAGVGRLEQGELLGDDQGCVVGQHDPARADPDPLGGGGDHRDEDRRVRRRHGRHVVVLGQPVAAVAVAGRRPVPASASPPARHPVVWSWRTGTRSRTDSAGVLTCGPTGCRADALFRPVASQRTIRISASSGKRSSMNVAPSGVEAVADGRTRWARSLAWNTQSSADSSGPGPLRRAAVAPARCPGGTRAT